MLLSYLKNSFKLLWLYGNGLSTERKQGKRREKGGEYQGKRKEEGEKGVNGRREKEKRERMRKLGTRMGWMKEGEEEVGRKKKGGGRMGEKEGERKKERNKRSRRRGERENKEKEEEKGGRGGSRI